MSATRDAISATGAGKAGSSVIAMDIDAVPTKLREKLRWCVWKAQPAIGKNGTPEYKPNGKARVAKAPLSPAGYNISTAKPEQWADFETCAKAYEAGNFSGLGVLMHPSSELVGIDLDNVEDWARNEPEIKAALTRAKSEGVYCEYSPSGSGLRLFVEGTKDSTLGKKAGPFELYNDMRHLTVTGRRAWPGDVKSAQWLIDAIQNRIQVLQAKPAPKAAALSGSVTPVAPTLADDIAAALKKGHSDLWAGQWQTPIGRVSLHPGYPSQSEADMALIGAITREAVKRGVTDELTLETLTLEVFQRSGLYRAAKHQTKVTQDIPKAAATALNALAVAGVVVGSTSGSAAAAWVMRLAMEKPGDTLGSRLFADMHRGRLIYVGPRGAWLRWDGTRWLWCDREEHMAAAKASADAILAATAKLYSQDADLHKGRLAYATQLQNRPKLEAMIELAKSEQGMTVGGMHELDADPWLICTRNGVIDLRTGGMLAPAPSMLITRQVAASYQRDAQCPLWLKFLDEVFMADADTIGFVQRGLGYTLTGCITEEAMFISYGFGINGKSVFANVVTTVMADYGQTAPPSLITGRKDGDGSPRNDIARMCGVRMASVNETQSGDRLDEQVVKMLAGRESLSARFLHKEFFDFIPTAKAWVRTNHRPIILGDDDGIWRRIMLIPFKRKFAEHERDPWLEQKLLDEREGILAWMVEGCLQWQRNGLKPSTLVRAEVGIYRKESDVLGEFLDEVTVVDSNGRIEHGNLWGRYRFWSESNGSSHGSKTSFTRRLAERGVLTQRSNGKSHYRGVALRNPTAPAAAVLTP